MRRASMKRSSPLLMFPPFREAAWHDGKISSDDYLPYFACKVIGDVMKKGDAIPSPIRGGLFFAGRPAWWRAGPDCCEYSGAYWRSTLWTSGHPASVASRVMARRWFVHHRKGFIALVTPSSLSCFLAFVMPRKVFKDGRR